MKNRGSLLKNGRSGRGGENWRDVVWCGVVWILWIYWYTRCDVMPTYGQRRERKEVYEILSWSLNVLCWICCVNMVKFFFLVFLQFFPTVFFFFFCIFPVVWGWGWGRSYIKKYHIGFLRRFFWYWVWRGYVLCEWWIHVYIAIIT